MLKLFKNLKIVTKLLSLSIFLAIFIAVVGFIGLNNMDKINDNTAILYDL